MAAECVDGSSPGHDFATVEHSLRDDVLLPSFQGDAPTFYDQRIATLHDEHIFIVIVDMRGGRGSFRTGPECHLASVHSIEDVPLHSRSCLIGRRNPIGRMLHELGKSIH